MTPVPVTSAGLMLQAGAFSNLTHADQLKVRLMDLTGHPAFVVKVDDDDLYRVRLGPLPDRGEALRVQALIAAANFGRAMIVGE